MDRRYFFKALALASMTGATGCSLRKTANANANLYDSFPLSGQLRIIHLTDSHGQLLPNYYREASLNLGFNSMLNRPPHIVGQALIDYYQLDTPQLKYAFSHVGFEELAKKYGKTGGYSHLATLVKRLRTEAGNNNSLLLDGGDSWQGSGLNLWERGKDMVKASNLLGVDAMTGHWEFTYHEKEIRENIELFDGEFLANNVVLTDDASFNDEPAYDSDTGQVFKPYQFFERGGVKVAVIGQAFPYTSIANPRRFIPNWSFGIRASELQETVDKVKAEKAQVVILLSHNGMDVDLKLASQVTGIDIILGGHTHDITVKPMNVKNSGGVTQVVSGGSHGKCLGVFDLQVKNGKMSGFSYRLLPVFSNQIPADAEMQKLIDELHQPYQKQLAESLATTETLLYRRGNFNGTFDQIICDALRVEKDAQISLSPGFRWGTSVLAGSEITMGDLLTQTAMTYPETYRNIFKGEQIKLILEDVADNLYNADPYYQQGGDMVRTGGIQYTIDPQESMGKRITNLQLTDGKPIQASKEYTVAGWSTVGSQSEGEPIWDITARYLKNSQNIQNIDLETPQIKGVQGNKGFTKA